MSSNKKDILRFRSLGLPSINIHRSINHFDFTKPSRRILVVGSMGSGKTEYSARIWRDAKVALRKSDEFALSTIGIPTSDSNSEAPATSTSATSTSPRENNPNSADRRRVFYIRSLLDAERFSSYPPDALAYRGGYEQLGNSIATIRDSFELEEIMQKNPQAGTWVLDEASFYDERIAYLSKRESERRGITFVFPTLILNFRNEIFNSTARLLLDNATDVFPLSAYCEHEDCMADSYFTYRYYRVNGQECPALYFDPLIIVGGDDVKDNPLEPNYCTRCETHHYLPGKEYCFLALKPLGAEAARGKTAPLKQEIELLKTNITQSTLNTHLEKEKSESPNSAELIERSLLVPNIAEKALIYLFMEQNLISEAMLRGFIADLTLDSAYIHKRIQDGGRSFGKM